MAPVNAVFKMLKAGAEVSTPNRKCNGSDFGSGGGLFHLSDHPNSRISAKSAGSPNKIESSSLSFSASRLTESNCQTLHFVVQFQGYEPPVFLPPFPRRSDPARSASPPLWPGPPGSPCQTARTTHATSARLRLESADDVIRKRPCR